MKNQTTLPFPNFIGIAPSNAVVLRRLFALRIFVQCSFVLYVVGFKFPLSTAIFVGLIVLASAVFSLSSWRLGVRSSQPAIGFLALQLLWDSTVLMAFVWLAGRSTNPFIYYQLLVIAISASILPEKFAWLFSALGICAYSSLIYVDLGHHVTHMDTSFKSHLIGMWINFSGSALLIAFFISRLSSTLRRQDEALRLAREDNLKNEQLIGIGTLAASTVHSFGTPLSTITMATSELDALHSDDESRACTSIINAQIGRCKATMKKLTSLTTRKTLYEQKISIGHLANEIEEYLHLVNAQPMPTIRIHSGLENQDLPGGILLLHAVINLIDNAVAAARSRVAISIDSTHVRSGIQILIEDDGKGIQPEVFNSADGSSKNSENGLGIGLLLVNSTIERLGGTVTYRNPSDSKSLTQITVELPCARPEAVL